jgi:hypothetical protein
MKHTLLILLVLSVTTAACTSSADTSSLTSTTTSPSATLVTDTFTGTVPVGSSDIHTFVLSQAGELDVTLTAAGPPPTIFMGIGVGTLSGTSCVFLSGSTANVQASTTAQLAGSNIAAGTYCVAVYDIGNQAAPVTYALTVVHP